MRRRNKAITIRLTEEEYALLCSKLKQTGVSQQAYIISAIKDVSVIPSLDGLKQSEAVNVINSWGVSEISLSDWKNCSRAKRQENMLPRELIEETLQRILSL